MKKSLVLCSVALPALCVGTAAAQVSIPLPQAPRTSPPTSIPLPGSPIPLPPTPTPAPAPMTPQFPIGAHGRPDINPYDRDIEMTVPLNFQSSSLGDIPMLLTADDRFLLESASFLRLMQPVLNEEAHAALSAQLAPLTNFGPDDLGKTGVQLTYDPSTLAVVVVEVSAEQRAIQDIFAPPREDANDVSLQPADFSAYLNLSAVQTYVWEGSRADPPTINFDGALRFGRVVFEGDAQLGQQFGLTGDSYKFSRNYARLVYDQPEEYRRFFLGDLDPEVRGQQSFVEMVDSRCKTSWRLA